MNAIDLLQLYHNAAQSTPGVLVLTPIVEGKKPRPQKFSIGDVEGMAAEATARGEHANVYFAPAVLRQDLPIGQRGKAEDIVAQLGLVIDDDPDTGKPAVLPPIEPSAVVETSPGNRHIHFVFTRPLPPAEAELLARLLHSKCGGDSGTADVAHVWRIPDTLNIPTATKIKRGRSKDPQPVTLTEDGTLRPVDPDELRRVLDAMPDLKPADPKPNGGTGTHRTARSREELLASLPGDIVDMIETEGEDRSEHCFATMAALFERGWWTWR